MTRPLFPDLRAYASALEGIWQRRWLTNKGEVHEALERALCDCLGVRHLSLVANGTMALMLAYRVCGLAGEVVTTPFTSPATINALIWCGLTPVFADIDPSELTLAPAAVERAITQRTCAIVGVHIYGMPCQVEPLQAIAARHGLRVIYDGAHAFGTEIAGVPIANFGDATALSFHATKLFNTAEGGAIVVGDPDLKRQIDMWRTLGYRDEVTVLVPGINARMNELEAALGLANLDLVDAERDARAQIAQVYLSRLTDYDGLTCFEIPANVSNSQLYFVVLIDAARAPVTREELCEQMKAFNVFARRYFYPLCSNLSFYRDLPSAEPGNLPVANRAAKEVLCLPFYGSLGIDGAHRVCDVLDYLFTA